MTLVLALAPFDPDGIGEGPELRRIAEQLSAALPRKPAQAEPLAWLPKGVLAATILVAVLSGLRLQPYREAWRFSRPEALPISCSISGAWRWLAMP